MQGWQLSGQVPAVTTAQLVVLQVIDIIVAAAQSSSHPARTTAGRTARTRENFMMIVVTVKGRGGGVAC